MTPMSSCIFMLMGDSPGSHFAIPLRHWHNVQMDWPFQPTHCSGSPLSSLSSLSVSLFFLLIFLSLSLLLRLSLQGVLLSIFLCSAAVLSKDCFLAFHFTRVDFFSLSGCTVQCWTAILCIVQCSSRKRLPQSGNSHLWTNRPSRTLCLSWGR